MRPAGGGSAGSPALVNYLNEALSARGPNALPYANDLWWPIREHMVQLLQARACCAAAAHQAASPDARSPCAKRSVTRRCRR
jgi:hypothetical protein